jgi:hypothetical protein
MSTAFIRKNTIYLIIFKSCHQLFIETFLIPIPIQHIKGQTYLFSGLLKCHLKISYQANKIFGQSLDDPHCLKELNAFLSKIRKNVGKMYVVISNTTINYIHI